MRDIVLDLFWPGNDRLDDADAVFALARARRLERLLCIFKLEAARCERLRDENLVARTGE